MLGFIGSLDMSIEGMFFTISAQGCVYSGHPTQGRHPFRNRHRTEKLCTTAVVRVSQ